MTSGATGTHSVGISRDGDSVASLCSLFQCFDNPFYKEFFVPIHSKAPLVQAVSILAHAVSSSLAEGTDWTHLTAAPLQCLAMTGVHCCTELLHCTWRAPCQAGNAFLAQGSPWLQGLLLSTPRAAMEPPAARALCVWEWCPGLSWIFLLPQWRSVNISWLQSLVLGYYNQACLLRGWIKGQKFSMPTFMKVSALL